jgi:nucleoside-diphosphate-sugar epimerase
MRIVLTGGSSLTGYWFAKELKDQGHEVICTLTRGCVQDYSEEKSYMRVQKLAASGMKISWGIEFGTVQFCQLLRKERVDMLCLHGAHIPDYRSANFNIAESLSKNLFNINEVFTILAKNSIPFVLTGTYFEPGEGDFGNATEAVSPYGLAKHLISEAFEFYAKKFGVPMAKFIISNPIGPLEDKKFTAYLVDCWKKNQMATVKTPLFVRDNIHVQLLAKAYVGLVLKLAQQKKECSELLVSRPSGYRESQGEFTARVARELGPRLGLSCNFELAEQTDFLEPLSRVNSDDVQSYYSDFSEKQAWDELAKYHCN